ncbi:hypothetical protein QR680_006456 [Steinernema hermaphroditum]|uniref:Uncharacterized protein n=1 Tax=Steinernema hermaphroditum TaxID=289476 RepID=A0AA39HVL7_9BILA|nr:hypothetical protein QR680_006456 [Steinernema hermaphroditum]
MIHDKHSVVKMDSLMYLPSEGLFVQMHKIRVFLRLLRCRFAKEIPRREKRINKYIFLLIQIQTLYHLGYVANYVWKGVKEGNVDASSMCYATVALNWILQSFISTCYIRSWQRRSSLKNFLYLLYNAQYFAGCRRKMKRLNGILMAMFVLIGFITAEFVIYTTLSWFVITPSHFDLYNQMMYHYRPLYLIGMTTAIYNFTIWTIVLAIYILCTKAAHIEFSHFNHRIRNIGKEGSKPVEEDLLELVQVHRKLAKAVRCLDSLFEKYAFIMLATNIPTTIFSILLLGSSAGGFTFSSILIALPSLAFCFVQLMGLTATPASLYKSTCMSKEFLFSNRSVWQPYRPDIYQIATYLLSHLSQSNLGVSIWGFAVVTKPLILTTLSAMVTLLALLLELRRKN